MMSISMNSHTTGKQTPFVSMQILRVFACFGVFLCHFAQRTHIGGMVGRAFAFQMYCVQMFLMISGFFAAKSLSHNNPDWRLYYKKRFIRIAPLYYSVILWFFISENLLNLFIHQIPPDEYHLGWLRYIFLLNGFVNSDSYFWSNLGATWTIPVFAFFYLIAPFVCKHLKGYKSAFCFWLLSYILFHFISKLYSCTIVDNLSYAFLGIACYYAFRDSMGPQICILLQTFSIALLVLYDKPLDASLLLFGSIVILCALSDGHAQKLSPRLKRIISVLDEHSFTLYLVHCLVLISFVDRMKSSSNILRGIVAIAGTAIGTFAVHRYVEKPLQRMLSKALLCK